MYAARHERWDGSGYPRGLRGGKIPQSARVFAAVDVYDALTSNRPNRPAMSHAEAMEIVLAGRGSHFDPEIIDVFARMMEDEAAA
jgi:HD-GYP domain-containing protein (c-di-GMP phosphodiesterase class II)